MKSPLWTSYLLLFFSVAAMPFSSAAQAQDEATCVRENLTQIVHETPHAKKVKAYISNFLKSEAMSRGLVENSLSSGLIRAGEKIPFVKYLRSRRSENLKKFSRAFSVFFSSDYPLSPLTLWKSTRLEKILDDPRFPGWFDRYLSEGIDSIYPEIVEVAGKDAEFDYRWNRFRRYAGLLSSVTFAGWVAETRIKNGLQAQHQEVEKFEPPADLSDKVVYDENHLEVSREQYADDLMEEWKSSYQVDNGHPPDMKSEEAQAELQASQEIAGEDAGRKQ